MIIYGRRKIRIKKYDNYLTKCEHCNSYEQRYAVYQEYFHIFFIPFFPSSIKTIKSFCIKCKDTFSHEKRNHYLSITRTPIYFYTGIILFVGLFFTAVLGNITTQKKKAEYVSNPKISDVYLIREDENKEITYYFLKIRNINSDTVELLHSSLQYNRYVSTMIDSDYFVKNDIFRVLKSDLKSYLDSGIINMVERDYDKMSRFMVEK